MEMACECCGNPGKFVCGGCKRTLYCSTNCQNADWVKHKPKCGFVNEESVGGRMREPYLETIRGLSDFLHTSDIFEYFRRKHIDTDLAIEVPNRLVKLRVEVYAVPVKYFSYVLRSMHQPDIVEMEIVSSTSHRVSKTVKNVYARAGRIYLCGRMQSRMQTENDAMDESMKELAYLLQTDTLSELLARQERHAVQKSRSELVSLLQTQKIMHTLDVHIVPNLSEADYESVIGPIGDKALSATLFERAKNLASKLSKDIPSHAFYIACSWKNLSLAQFFAEKHKLTIADIRVRRYDAFFVVCQLGAIDIFRWMVGRFGLSSLDAISANYTAVILAATHNQLDMLQGLHTIFSLDLDNKIGVTYKLFEDVCSMGFFEVAQWLYDKYDAQWQKLCDTYDELKRRYIDKSYLSNAIVGGHYDIVEWAYSHALPPQLTTLPASETTRIFFYAVSIFRKACVNGQTRVAELLYTKMEPAYRPRLVINASTHVADVISNNHLSLAQWLFPLLPWSEVTTLPGFHVSMYSAVKAACKKDFLDMLQWLYSKFDAYVPKIDPSMLVDAVYSGDMNMFRWIEQRCRLTGFTASIDEWIQTDLFNQPDTPARTYRAYWTHLASFKQDEMLRFLITGRTIPKKLMYTTEDAFVEACQAGHLSTARLLAERFHTETESLDSATKMNIVTRAATRNHAHIISWLRTTYGLPDTINRQFLNTILGTADLDLIKLFCEHYQLNQRTDLDRQAVLKNVVENDDLDAAKYLAMTIGITVIDLDLQHRNSALHIACRTGKFVTAQWLLNNFQIQNVPDHLFDEAFLSGSVEILELLYAVERSGRFAVKSARNILKWKNGLHIACIYGHLNIAQWIIKVHPVILQEWIKNTTTRPPISVAEHPALLAYNSTWDMIKYPHVRQWLSTIFTGIEYFAASKI